METHDQTVVILPRSVAHCRGWVLTSGVLWSSTQEAAPSTSPAAEDQAASTGVATSRHRATSTHATPCATHAVTASAAPR